MRKYCCLLGSVVLLITGCLALFTGCGDERVDEEEMVEAEEGVAVPPPAPEGMVLIPAGECLMGTEDPHIHPEDDFDGGSLPNEQPIHTVYVDAFYMDTHEVTSVEYVAFLNAEGKPAEGDEQWWCLLPMEYTSIEYVAEVYRVKAGYEDHPVGGVAPEGAMAYAAWQEKRLPTETEWEKAARGGLSGQKYPWGDTIDATRANYDDHIGDTTTVGKYAANGYGLYDMCGNVAEWCSKVYDTGTKYGILRGGCWEDDAEWVRVFSRSNERRVLPEAAGFRCVRSVSP